MTWNYRLVKDLDDSLGIYEVYYSELEKLYIQPFTRELYRFIESLTPTQIRTYLPVSAMSVDPFSLTGFYIEPMEDLTYDMSVEVTILNVKAELTLALAATQEVVLEQHILDRLFELRAINNQDFPVGY